MPATTTERLKPSTVNGAVQAPETPEVPSEEKVDKGQGMVEIELTHQFVNSYTAAEAAAHGLPYTDGKVVFGPGKVKVRRDIAEDLHRRQQAVYQSNLDRIDGIKEINTVSGRKATTVNTGELG